MATLGKELADGRPSLTRKKSMPKSAEPVRKSRRHPDNLEGLRLHYASDYLSIRRKLGSGSYGDVYSGVWRGERVAVKVELQRTKQLLSEHNIYKALNEKESKLGRRPGESRFLKTFGLFHFEYSRQMINAMVFARAGASLEAVIEEGSPFAAGLDSLTVCSATVQLIDALRAVHELGFVHRDITPRNILLRRSAPRRKSAKEAFRRKLPSSVAEFDFRCESDTVYLIDFGLAKAIPSAATVDHRRECREPITNDVVGTPRYCSKRAHRRRSMCERDDLLSLVYVAAFVRKNALPWASRYRGEDRNKKIGIHKARTRARDLCESYELPSGMCDFAEAVDELGFGERPRYQRMIDAIKADIEALRSSDKSYLRHIADTHRRGECFSDPECEGVAPLCAVWNREHEYDVYFPEAAMARSPVTGTPSVDELEEMRMAEAMARVALTPPRLASSPKRARPHSSSRKAKGAEHGVAGVTVSVAVDTEGGAAARSPFREVQISLPKSRDVRETGVGVGADAPAKKRGSFLGALGAKIKLGSGGRGKLAESEVESVGEESPRKKRKVCA